MSPKPKLSAVAYARTLALWPGLGASPRSLSVFSLLYLRVEGRTLFPGKGSLGKLRIGEDEGGQGNHRNLTRSSHKYHIEGTAEVKLKKG